ncbi:hypothetical protein AVEN_26332-1 [Araneus ventricosus]|uniref:Uncharacterized protein n=1 Tax=Araneus ventricosus TaxID=182803 RepID=A0A4Y2APJ1_ARAVE|nr:hypothetical protein AVEN_26332-1 [Araneus ventricosus]
MASTEAELQMIDRMEAKPLNPQLSGDEHNSDTDSNSSDIQIIKETEVTETPAPPNTENSNTDDDGNSRSKRECISPENEQSQREDTQNKPKRYFKIFQKE